MRTNPDSALFPCSSLIFQMLQSHVVEQRAGPRAETWPTAGSLLPQRAQAAPTWIDYRSGYSSATVLSFQMSLKRDTFSLFTISSWIISCLLFCSPRSLFFPWMFFIFLTGYYSRTPLCLRRKRQTTSRKSVLEFYFDSINRFTDVF